MSAILIHINYFEQGQSLDRACRITRELGADGIEFRRKPSGYSRTDLEYLDEVSSALDQNPLEWISFGAPGIDLMTTDEAAKERELEAAEKFFRKAAARFPLRVVNTFTGDLRHPDDSLPTTEYVHHGSAIATDSQWESAANGFRRLAAIAEECDFRFAFETHGVYLHDTLEATLRLVSSIGSPRVGVLWDHANLTLFPNSPGFEDVVRTAGDSLFYVHLKNFLVSPSRFLAVSSLSGGILNIRDQLRQLHASGYRGPLCIESPRAGDREEFLREDLSYLRRLLEDQQDI